MIRQLLMMTLAFVCLTPPCRALAGEGVYLGPLSPGPHEQTDSPQLFPPQLIRQAVLLAAREELGAVTRDADLREESVAGSASLSVRSAIWRGDRVVVTLTTTEAPDQPIWQKTAPLPGGLADYDALARAVVGDESLVAALREAGVAGGEPTGWQDDGPADSEALELLGELSFVAQYAGVRRLHAQASQAGWSPQRLAAVVRGYANLCELTRPLWGLYSDVFGARAMLYAQRLSDSNAQPAMAAAVRAYAKALVGLHGPALAELNAIENPVAEESWPWSPTIRAWCAFDTPQLEELADSEHPAAGLAELFHALSFEHGWDHWRFGAAMTRALKRHPDCLRLIDPFCARTSGWSAKTRLPTARLMLDNALRRRLPAVTDAADEAIAILDEPGADWQGPIRRADAAFVLVDLGADDRQEPSLQVLGRLAEEWNFKQLTLEIDEYAIFRKKELASFVHRTGPAVIDHPMGKVFELSLISPYHDTEAWIKIEKNLPFDAVPMSMFHYLYNRKYKTIKPALRHNREGWERMHQQADDLYYDIARPLKRVYWRKYSQSLPEPIKMGFDQFKAELHRLDEVSPHAPVRIGYLIEHDFEYTAPLLETWRERYGHHLLVLGSLIRRAAFDADWTRCRELARAYRERLDEGWVRQYERWSYWAQGDIEGWTELCEQMIDQDLYERRWMNSWLCDWYMRTSQPEKMRPLLETMLREDLAAHANMASKYYEFLGRWDLSLAWLKRSIEKERHHAWKWYLWCHRTGQMATAEEALDVALPLFDGAPHSSPHAFTGGTIFLLSGDEKKARKRFRLMDMYKETSPYYWLMTGGVAQLIGGNRAARPFHRFAEQRKLHDRSGGLFSLLQTDYLEIETLLREARNNPDQPLDLAAIDALAEKNTPSAKCDYWFAAGAHLWAKRQEEAGQRLLLKAAQHRGFGYSRSFAMWWLRKQGVPEEPLQYDRQQWKDLPNLTIGPDGKRQPAKPAAPAVEPVEPAAPEKADPSEQGGLT